MTHYYLNIGSNLGNVRLNLSKAIRALEEKYGYFEASGIVESKPWGYVSPNTFANMAVMIVSDRTPHEILEDIHEIERLLNPTPHRDTEGHYSDRVLDIDIMAADDLIINTECLRIPHRHLPQRKFFLEPFAQLAPGWRHPENGKTCAEMLDAL